ncbi:MAG: hypothetical protein ACRCRT_06340, partial [Cetobacterium somerae]
MQINIEKGMKIKMFSGNLYLFTVEIVSVKNNVFKTKQGTFILNADGLFIHDKSQNEYVGYLGFKK